MDSLSRYKSRAMVKEYLTRHLSQLDFGEPLPPVRTLKKTLGVSLARLEGIFQEFVSQGLIERRARQGIFKARRAANAPEVRIIDLVACGQLSDVRIQGSFTAELVEALTAEAGRRRQAISLHQFGADDPISKYEALAARGEVRACIFFNLHLPELTAAFDRQDVAWVSLFPRTFHDARRCILASPEMVKIQLQHLWDLGHTRIAYLDHVLPAMPHVVKVYRREGYYRFMAEHGLRVEPTWVVPATNDDADVFSAFATIFSRVPYPTAAVVGDVQLPAGYRFLEGRALKVGRDFSLMGTDDLAIASALNPPATTVRNPLDVAARMAMDLLDQVLRGEESQEPGIVPVELIVRGSTGPAVTGDEKGQ